MISIADRNRGTTVAVHHQTRAKSNNRTSRNRERTDNNSAATVDADGQACIHATALRCHDSGGREVHLRVPAPRTSPTRGQLVQGWHRDPQQPRLPHQIRGRRTLQPHHWRDLRRGLSQIQLQGHQRSRDRRDRGPTQSPRCVKSTLIVSKVERTFRNSQLDQSYYESK